MVENGCETLTTVQHRGQNHHISSRAKSRNTTSNDISTMVPSNYTETEKRGKKLLNITKRTRMQMTGGNEKSTHSLLWWQTEERKKRKKEAREKLEKKKAACSEKHYSCVLLWTPPRLYSHTLSWWCEQSWWCRRAPRSCSPAGRSPWNTQTLIVGSSACGNGFQSHLRCWTHSRSAHTCWLKKTQICWQRLSAEAYGEVKESSAHRKNLHRLDGTQRSNVETTEE